MRARWAASAAAVASQAYAAAYGREIADDSTRVRWGLEPRVAVTAAIVLAIIGALVWWNAATGVTPPAYLDPTSVPYTLSASTEPVMPSSGNMSGAQPTPSIVLVVHVSGAVARPGLVTLAEGARVADAVQAAGGVEGEANLAAVNLARHARDGEQIHIPEVGAAQAIGEAFPSGPGPVDLNLASAEQLETLPGIGPVLSERIIADREAHGPFASLADLTRVSGVGNALVTRLDGLAVT